jgi:hypothetical protein
VDVVKLVYEQLAQLHELGFAKSVEAVKWVAHLTEALG